MGTDELHDGLAGEAHQAALPVLADPALPAQRVRAAVAFPPRERARVPVVQAAAVAAGSFVAGAAVAGLVRRGRRPTPAVAGGRVARALGRAGRGSTGRRGQRAAGGLELVEIVGSRSLLVDVHLLGPPASER